METIELKGLFSRNGLPYYFRYTFDLFQFKNLRIGLVEIFIENLKQSISSECDVPFDSIEFYRWTDEYKLVPFILSVESINDLIK